jgi:hypothetical protein
MTCQNVVSSKEKSTGTQSLTIDDVTLWAVHMPVTISRANLSGGQEPTNIEDL